jgi:type IV secretion system protein VirD4
MASRKFRIEWNPTQMHGRRGVRINPYDFLHADSPTLVSDTKMVCENKVSLTGSASGEYFEVRARELLEGIIVTNVCMYGNLTAGHLYNSINLIPRGGPAWDDFAFEMNQCGYPLADRVQEEITNAQNDSSGGQKGILGELFKAFACYSDPLLMESLSPPYDFSYEELTDPDRRYVVSLLVRPEHIGPWGAAIKSHFVAARIYKSRALQAPRQTWVLDEVATLASGGSKGFPMIPELFSWGAGIGIRPIAVVQTGKQLDSLAPNGQTIITARAFSA